MSINIALAKEQEQRVLEAQNAVEEQANLNTELECYGKWDGTLGYPPQQQYWGELAYREGYLCGITQHYDRKYNISLNQPF